METLNHIIIYNLVFSSINNCYMTSSLQMAALHFNLNCICNRLFIFSAMNPIDTQKPPN